MEKFNSYDYEISLGKCIYRDEYSSRVRGVQTDFLRNLPQIEALRVARALDRLADFEENKIQIDNDMMNKWIPCNERMPKEWEEVLVYDGSDTFVAWYRNYHNYKGWDSLDSRFDTLCPIIAWMPLPKPYIEEND